MKGDKFTIGTLAERITGGNERAVRKLLVDVGAHLDENKTDPRETVDRDVLIKLAAHRTGDVVGRRAVILLGETMIAQAVQNDR